MINQSMVVCRRGRFSTCTELQAVWTLERTVGGLTKLIQGWWVPLAGAGICLLSSLHSKYYIKYLTYQ